MEEEQKQEEKQEKKEKTSDFIQAMQLVAQVIIYSVIFVSCSITAAGSVVGSCSSYDGDDCVDACGLGEVEKCSWIEMKCKERVK